MQKPTTHSDFEVVMRRLREVLGYPTDAALARDIGMTTSNWANRKKTNSIPFDRVMPFAHSRGVSLSWLLFGEGEPMTEGGDRTVSAEIDTQLFAEAYIALGRQLPMPASEHDEIRRIMLSGLVYNRVIGEPTAKRRLAVDRYAHEIAAVVYAVEFTGGSVDSMVERGTLPFGRQTAEPPKRKR